MAIRPVFIVTLDDNFFNKDNTEFVFYSGFSIKQKQRSIQSLHNAFLLKYNNKKVLEISTKSDKEIGIRLSSFNLMLKTKHGKVFSVETAFQSSKVFEYGGPYKDLLHSTSRDAKTDMRLKTSGRLVSFFFNNQSYSIEPKTFFYNWLYINALQLNNDLAEQILEYDAFTDIAFNPEKSVNCQAEAAAIFVSLQKQGLLKAALKSKEKFIEIVYKNRIIKDDLFQTESAQRGLFPNIKPLL